MFSTCFSRCFFAQAQSDALEALFARAAAAGATSGSWASTPLPDAGAAEAAARSGVGGPVRGRNGPEEIRGEKGRE